MKPRGLALRRMVRWSGTSGDSPRTIRNPSIGGKCRRPRRTVFRWRGRPHTWEMPAQDPGRSVGLVGHDEVTDWHHPSNEFPAAHAETADTGRGRGSEAGSGDITTDGSLRVEHR